MLSRISIASVLATVLCSPTGAQNNILIWPTINSTESMTLVDAGDINNDGVVDLLGGSFLGVPPNGTSNEGYVKLYSGKDGSVLHMFQGNTGEGIGWDSDIADLNADGYDDIILGNPWIDVSGVSDAGEIRVYSGKDFSLLAALHGLGAQDDEFGRSARIAGDIDRDGTPDIIGGAWNGGANGTGYARVYNGKTFVLMAHIDGPPDPASGRVFSAFGVATRAAGDVNGDGFPDVIIGGHAFKNSATTTDWNGAAFVYSGSWIAFQIGTAQLYRFNGTGSGGFAVTGLGDLNGDGHADVAMSEMNHAPVSGLNMGRVQVFSGKDGSVLASILGRSAGSSFGWSLDRGDLDGDGIDDLFIGAVGENRIVVYSGADLGQGTLKTLNGFYGSYGPPGARLGWSTTFPGDVDQDGTMDVAGGHGGGIHGGGLDLLSSMPRTMYADKNVVSIGANDVVTLNLTAGYTNRNQSYLIAGSVTGTSPGVTFGGVTIPLNPDPYTDVTLGFANTRSFENFRGGTGAFGSGVTPRIWFTTPLSASVIGLVAHHAAFVYDATSGAPILASEPVILRFEK